MKLSEFAKQLNELKQPYIHQDKWGNIVSIMIWQHLIRKDEFNKIIEHKLSCITEKEFTEMARRPITLPTRPALKIVEADPYMAQDTTINQIIFYPEVDEGWVSAENTGDVRIHMFYYEK